MMNENFKLLPAPAPGTRKGALRSGFPGKPERASRLGVLVFCMLTVGCSSSTRDQTEAWVSIFNGKDLSGWTIKMGGQEPGEDVDSAYTAGSGVLKVYDGKRDSQVKIGHLFYEAPQSGFRLRFEYRFTGRQFETGDDWPEQYGGIVFHSQSPESMGLKQDYPVCLEFQLLGGKNTGNRSTGNVCTIGTRVFTNDTLNPAHCIQSDSPTFDGDQWVKGEMEVWGDSLIRQYIDGQMVLEYTRPQIGGGFVSEGFDWIKGNVKDWESWAAKDGTPLGSGYVGIQAHDPMEFRNIELLVSKR